MSQAMMSRTEARRRMRRRGAHIAERIHAAVVLNADESGAWEPVDGWRSISRATRLPSRPNGRRPSAPGYQMVCDGIVIATEQGWLTIESTPDRLELA